MNDINFYDDVVKTVLLNVFAEQNRSKQIILWNFNPTRPSDMLYYNVAITAGTLTDEDVFLNMPLLQYWRFKREKLQSNKRIKWLSWWRAKKVEENDRTSVSAIMEYVREFYKIDNNLFEKINKEFYGVRNEDICN